MMSIQGTCKYRECIYVHAPKLLEQEYLQTGEYQDTTTATTDGVFNSVDAV